jgi:hypothetical protein
MRLCVETNISDIRSQKRPRKKGCLKNPVSAVATWGFEEFWKGGSEPITLSEKKICSVGRTGCMLLIAGEAKN